MGRWVYTNDPLEAPTYECSEDEDLMTEAVIEMRNLLDLPDDHTPDAEEYGLERKLNAYEKLHILGIVERYSARPFYFDLLERVRSDMQREVKDFVDVNWVYDYYQSRERVQS